MAPPFCSRGRAISEMFGKKENGRQLSCASVLMLTSGKGLVTADAGAQLAQACINDCIHEATPEKVKHVKNHCSSWVKSNDRNSRRLGKGFFQKK